MAVTFFDCRQEKKWPPKRWSKPPADFDVSMVMTTAKWSALWVKDEAEEEEHSAEDYPTPRHALVPAMPPTAPEPSFAAQHPGYASSIVIVRLGFDMDLGALLNLDFPSAGSGSWAS